MTNNQKIVLKSEAFLKYKKKNGGEFTQGLAVLTMLHTAPGLS